MVIEKANPAGIVGEPMPSGGDADSSQSGQEDQSEHHSREMPFLDHLEELRRRIIASLIAIVIGCAVCFYFSDTILDILTRPAKSLGVPIVNMRVVGMFLVKLHIALAGGLVLALPVALYQLWRFVSPGLLRHERRYAVGIACASTCGFLAGASIAYFFVFPGAIRFLYSMSADYVTNYYSINDYIGFLLRLLLAFGAVFQLPVVAWFLARLGLVTPAFLRKNRKYAVVIVFILAAILTPGPDPLSQMMMAVPLMILYEISILVAKTARR